MAAPTAPTTPTTSTIFTGRVEKVFVRKDAFVVLQVGTDAPIADLGLGISLGKSFKVIGEVVGALSVGAYIRCEGRPIESATYGRQFKAASIAQVAPNDARALQNYMVATFKGVGRVLAQRIIAAYAGAAAAAADTLDRIIENPDPLLAIADPTVAQAMLASIRNQKSTHDASIFLRKAGVSTNKIAEVFATHGNRAARVITKTPYALVPIIGFDKCDTIAAMFELEGSPDRITEGMVDVAGKLCRQDGHCALPEDDLVRMSCDRLEVAESVVKIGVDSLIASFRMMVLPVLGQRLMFIRSYWDDEEVITGKLRQITGRPPAPLIVGRDYAFAREPSADQRAALDMIAANPVSIITGGPGTGKTTIIGNLIELADAQGITYHLCAPTGLAAKRLSEKCKAAAYTVCRSIGGRDAADLPMLGRQLIVVDEMSMVGLELFAQLMAALNAGTRLVLVGDADQLPSIAPGNVLADLIDSGKIAYTRLTKIHRQSEHSMIIENAMRVNAGEMVVGGGDFFMIQHNSPDEIIAAVVHHTMQLRAVAADPNFDVQVMVPMKIGAVGADVLNERLRAVINPGASGVGVAPGALFVGDKVIQLANDYGRGVVNGDIGIVETVAPNELVVQFPGIGSVHYEPPYNSLKLAYVLSIHKGQGSEFAYTIIVLANEHRHMLTRKLVYTALTRGKQKVIIIGHKSAVEAGIDNDKASSRYTGLGLKIAAS